MLAAQTWRKRRLLSRAEELTDESRFIDFGLRVYVVRQDHDHGRPMRVGEPPVAALAVHEFGGIFDATTQAWTGEPSGNPVVWTLSERQFPVAAHGMECRCCGVSHGADLPLRVLCYGAMGAGKTRGVLVPWLGFRAIEHAGTHREVGATAPTRDRLEMVRQGLEIAMPPDWYTYHVADTLFRFACGVRVRLQATKQQSAEIGSPVQGWNWVDCGSDEIQDSLNADSDIEARGRAAPGGRYKRLNTATAKDSPAWRTWRESLSPNLWTVRHLEGPSNPFVWPNYWEDLKETMSDRDYRRKVLAQDVGPERMVYHTWDRAQNLRPRPLVGARDITQEVLRRFGHGYTILVGHDPGKLCDVSVMLKAYKVPGIDAPVWWVVDELTTRETTTEQHAAQLLRRLREKWATNPVDYAGRPIDGPQAHIRIDPYGDSDNKTDKSVYQVFRHLGLDARSAAYKQGQGKGRVPKEAGIEMVVRLLCNANGVRRLFVDCDERRRPVAPEVVASFEMSERNASGEAEADKKDVNDRSHWMAALRYALHPLERRMDASGMLMENVQ